MRIPLKDYDFARARQRLAARFDREKMVTRDLTGAVEPERSAMLRRIAGASDALRVVEGAVFRALRNLLVEQGGIVTAAGPMATEITPDKPLVQALRVLGTHPSYVVEPHFSLGLVDYKNPASWHGGPLDAGPPLAKLQGERAASWSPADFESIVEGALRGESFGNIEVEGERLVFELAPGSRVGSVLAILGYSGFVDVLGAYDPAFTSAATAAVDPAAATSAATAAVDPAAATAARSEALAKDLLARLDAPKSAERIAHEEQKAREDEAALEDFYVRTGQKPKP